MRFRKTKFAKAFPLGLACLAFAFGIGFRSADAIGVNAESSSQASPLVDPSRPTVDNGYLSVSGSDVALHLNGGTSFLLNNGVISFYNTLGFGASNLTSNYDFTIGNASLYLGSWYQWPTTTVLDGVSLRFQLGVSYAGQNAVKAVAQWVAVFPNSTEYGLCRSTETGWIDRDPNPNQLIQFDITSWTFWQNNGLVTIREDSSVVLPSPIISLLVDNLSDFQLGDQTSTVLDLDQVLYSFLNPTDLINAGFDFHMDSYAPSNVVDGALSVNGLYSGFPTVNLCMVPYQMHFVRNNYDWSWDSVSFFLVDMDLATALSYRYFRDLPFICYFYGSGATRDFQFYGNVTYLTKFSRNSNQYRFQDGLNLVSHSYDGNVYFEYSIAVQSQGDAATLAISYYLDMSLFYQYAYGLAITDVYDMYLKGWNDGRLDLLASTLSDTAYTKGYEDGRKAGYSEGFAKGQTEKTSTVFSLFGAVVSVPVNLLNGLSPLVIWDTPIISIILTFLFLGVFLFIVKRFI